MLSPASGRGADHLFHPSGIPIRRTEEGLEGQPAPGRAQVGDVVQQTILRVRGKVSEQTLGDPRGRLGRIEAAAAQRIGPIVTQVGRHHPQIRGRLGTQAGERLSLELEHPRLIDLEHRRIRRPWQPVPACVEPRRQDHRLPNAGGGRVQEELIEVAGAHHQLGRHSLQAPGRVGVVHIGSIQFSGCPSGEELDTHGTNQRFGERVVDEGLGRPGRPGPSRGDQRGGRADTGG